MKHGTQATLFSEAEKKWIQKALEEVVVPSGTSSVPKDLGDVRHGKLKDDEWRSLFMYIIPLVVMDLLVLDVDNLKRLFNSKTVMPNHLYALHIPDQLSFWGPLGGIAEWGGERLIGILQRSKTNNRQGSMDATILREGCELQRLLVQDSILEEEEYNKAPQPKYIVLDCDTYKGLLEAYRQRDDESIRRYESIPHPLYSKILDGSAQALSHCAGFNNLRISVMQPNNVVMFVDEGVKLLVVGKLSPPVIRSIKSERIQATCAYCTLPQDTFGLTSKSIILQVVDRH
ncbi:hypothetical protein PSHT_04651 [Puccinia striiformis]|uniref:Uncharacterized protein n=1 Tax=Puccinia striiformis TaxID=27350 RepID=A0A2S4WCD4_9BASI|nr:hypothetical protein PSHT_04651 [Puccinia striiformis]